MNKTIATVQSTLIAEITAAFDGVTRDDGVTLHQAVVRDNYGSPEEETAARAKDTETRWQDVPHEDIRTTDAVLSFLDDKGFHYYIPAYLLWYLDYTDPNRDEEDDPGDSNTLDSLSYHLTGGVLWPLTKYQQARFAVFTPEQSRAIAHFLLYMAQLCEFSHMLMATGQWSGALTEEDTIIWESAGQRVAENRLTDPSARDAKQGVDRYWGQFMK